MLWIDRPAIHMLIDRRRFTPQPVDNGDAAIDSFANPPPEAVKLLAIAGRLLKPHCSPTNNLNILLLRFYNEVRESHPVRAKAFARDLEGRAS